MKPFFILRFSPLFLPDSKEKSACFLFPMLRLLYHYERKQGTTTCQRYSRQNRGLYHYERKLGTTTKELQQQLSQPVVTSTAPPIAADEEYDVFVSHAYEDKESFVDEFVEALRNQGLKVWYDTDKLKWGDSMREKIDRGLAKSKYGVVILSPNYIAEHKYWTKAELNGLFQVETINGKTILPIWHNLTKKQVVEYSPIIADRKAMTTASMTPEEIAAELKELFAPDDTEEQENG